MIFRDTLGEISSCWNKNNMSVFGSEPFDQALSMFSDTPPAVWRSWTRWDGTNRIQQICELSADLIQMELITNGPPERQKYQLQSSSLCVQNQEPPALTEPQGSRYSDDITDVISFTSRDAGLWLLERWSLWYPSSRSTSIAEEPKEMWMCLCVFRLIIDHSDQWPISDQWLISDRSMINDRSVISDWAVTDQWWMTDWWSITNQWQIRDQWQIVINDWSVTDHD